MIALNLHQRPARGTSLLMPLTAYTQDWRHVNRAVGGYWQADCKLTGLSTDAMVAFYESYLGCVVKELTFGMVTWEGLIQEMRLTQRGREYARSLAPEVWHNKVDVAYTLYGGYSDTVGWSENTDSSDEYGEMGQVVTIGQTDTTAATAVRDRHLEEFAWPRSRVTGGLSLGGAAKKTEADALALTCAGFWPTLGWRYQSTSLDDTVQAMMRTLVGASEFVTAGRIEANTLAAALDCTNPQRIGDLIEQLVAMGDSSGNSYQAGVYGGRVLDYEPVPTTAAYLLRAGQLLDLNGAPVLPSTVRAGFLVQILDSPFAIRPSGVSNLWDNPGVAYVDEVEYNRPDGLKLKFSGAEEGIDARLANLAELGQ